MSGVDPEFRRLAELLIKEGSEQLVHKLEKIEGWSKERLSQLLTYLAPLGGSGWPSRLCAFGADLNYIDDEGQTPLSQCVHGARKNEDGTPGNQTFETAIELLFLGADPNSTYLSSYSVAYLAALGNQPEFVLLFLLAGADIEMEEPDKLVARQKLRNAILKSGIHSDKAIRKDWPKQVIALYDKFKSRNQL